jgi:2-alkyl-3-oxoalkanoate reductase
VLDVLDARTVRAAVAAIRPEAIIYQATALAKAGFSRKLDLTFAQTNRLRTEGTDILLAAARDAGVRRFLAQSFAPYRYARDGRAGQDRGRPARPRPAPPQRARPLPR